MLGKRRRTKSGFPFRRINSKLAQNGTMSVSFFVGIAVVPFPGNCGVVAEDTIPPTATEFQDATQQNTLLTQKYFKKKEKKGDKK